MAIIQIRRGLPAGGETLMAAERQFTVFPNHRPSRPRYPVIYTHGAGSGADAMKGYARANYRTRIFGDAGLTAVSGDFGGQQTWGNDRAMAAMKDAFDWLQYQPGVRRGKAALVGGSMGGLNAFVFAAMYPELVSCISAYIPVISPAQIHDRHLVFQGKDYAQYVDMGYAPGGWVDALKPTKDPLHMAGLGKYAGIPILIHYGLQDPLCLPENVPEFQRRVGGNLVTIRGLQGGHEEATELQVDREAERDYVLSYS